MIEKVMNWAKAWSSKDFDIYTGSYTPDYRDKFNTHAQWVKHRRGRILRPGDIKVEVSDFPSNSAVAIEYGGFYPGIQLTRL